MLKANLQKQVKTLNGFEIRKQAYVMLMSLTDNYP